MLRIITLTLLLSALYAHAQTQYRVIAPGATSVSVNVGGNTYPLTYAINSQVPYFTGSVSATGNYYYIAGGVAEGFTRTFPSGRSSTFNDFLGRQATVQDLVQLPQVFPAWNRSLGTNGIYDDNYILTAFFTGIDSSNSRNPPSSGVSFAIFTKEDYYYTANAEVTTKNNGDYKFQLKVALSTPFHGYSIFKFRPSMYDPVFFREKLYNDLLQSLGCPHQQTNPTRVYLNGKGQGLYHLQEDMTTYDFITTQFYGSYVTPPSQYGSPLEGGSGSDFSSKNDAIYNFISNYGDDSKTALTQMITQIEALDSSNYNAIQSFAANYFEIETFLRAMLLEWLGGHWDSYWFLSSNFIIYNDPKSTSGKLIYFADEDFDQTLGAALPYANSYTSESYSAFVNKQWPTDDGGAPQRNGINKLLNNPTVNAHFQDLIKAFVKTVYNPNIVTQRINALKDRLSQDIIWDKQTLFGTARYIYNSSPKQRELTLSDYNTNFNSPVSGFDAFGLIPFITQRANYVASTYSVTFNSGTLIPTSSGSTSTSTSGSAVPSTTGSAVPSTTGKAVPSTTGKAAPSTTGSAPAPPATTGKVAPATTGKAVPSTTGKAAPSTTGAAVPSTTGSAPSPPGTIVKQVAFKFEQVQDWYQTAPAAAVLNAFKNAGVPVTIGIIPNQFGTDSSITTPVKNSLSSCSPRVEIAVNGFNFETLSGKTLDQQTKILQNATNKVKSTLSVTPTTLFPPGFAFNANTETAMKTAGYVFLSSWKDVDTPPYSRSNPNVWHFPAGASTFNTNDDTKRYTGSQVWTQAQTQYNSQNFAVIDLTPSEFTNDGTDNVVNTTMIGELVNLLNLAKGSGVNLVLISELAKQYGGPASTATCKSKRDLNEDSLRSEKVGNQVNLTMRPQVAFPIVSVGIVVVVAIIAGVAVHKKIQFYDKERKGKKEDVPRPLLSGEPKAPALKNFTSLNRRASSKYGDM